MNSKISFHRTALGLAASLALAACGSGGGSTTATSPVVPPVTPVLPAAANVQGIWNASSDTATSASAIILDNGDAWIVLQQGTTLTGFAKGTLALTGSTYSGSGTQYRFQDNTAQPITVSGSLQDQTTLLATISNGLPTPIGSFKLTYDRRYETPAVQSDASGRWQATFNGGANVVTLNIDPAGVLAGTSTTGCTYVGSLKTRPGGKAVFDLTLNEACLNSSATLAGIGTLNQAKTSLAIAFTSADGTRGGLLIGQR